MALRLSRGSVGKEAGENPKVVLRRASAARLRRARAEDRLDAMWLERSLALTTAAQERSLAWFEALMAVQESLPPRPEGFEQRQRRCNRCGNATEMNHDFDALYCRQCNRWIDAKCSDPACQFCSGRPKRPLA